MQSSSLDGCAGAATPAPSPLTAHPGGSCGCCSHSTLRLAIRWAVAPTVAMFSASAAWGQCVAGGPVASVHETSWWTPAIASASSGIATLIGSINAVNTAFSSQSNAFVGSPPNPQPDQEGGGVWARGVGGHLTLNTTTTAGNLHIDGPQQGSIGCNNRIQQDFAGVQVGADFARLNINGWNLHAGLTTGYLGSQNRDDGAAAINPAATFSSTLQVPFAGVYGAASYGGLLIDAQVRGEFFQSEVTDVFNGAGLQHTGAQGISITGNVAYLYNLGNRWFIEPSAGFAWTSVGVEPLNYAGTRVTGTGLMPPWALTVNDIDSALGRLGVRVGTTVTAGDMVLQPFASVGVFHDFASTATAALTSDFAAVGNTRQTYSSTIATTGVGTYGQFGLGVAAQFADTGWAGYFRSDYRSGEVLQGWTLNGGLRYQFTPGPVRTPGPMAAKAPVDKAGAHDWTGFHVGADVGAAFGFTTWKLPDSTAVAPHFAGVLGGGDVGYDRQIGRWVLGVEASAGWTNAHGATGCSGMYYTCQVSFSSLSTVTARIGYALDRLLPYLKVGAVIAQEHTGISCNTGSQPAPLAVPAMSGCPGETDSRTEVGWTAGAGYEFALTQHVSAKAEVLYFDLGSDSHTLGVPVGLQKSGVMSTLGLHYRFGG